jgi:hypothetical protein
MKMVREHMEPAHAAQTPFVLSTAILSAAVGFVFAVLGLLVSQWYQRRLERRTLSNALLTEALSILDRLQFYEEILDKADPDASLPNITVTRDDMQVYLSNTGKVGLLLYLAPMYIIQFYARVRQVASGAPTRDLIGVIPKSSLSKLDALRREISDAITAGHAVVNSLARQVPKERLSAASGANIDLWTFRRRAEERQKRGAVNPGG